MESTDKKSDFLAFSDMGCFIETKIKYNDCAVSSPTDKMNKIRPNIICFTKFPNIWCVLLVYTFHSNEIAI